MVCARPKQRGNSQKWELGLLMLGLTTMPIYLEWISSIGNWVMGGNMVRLAYHKVLRRILLLEDF